MKKDRSLLLALSLVIGIVLACAILPLGGMALLMVSVDKNSSSTGPLSATHWREQVISGSGTNRVLVLYVTGIIGIGDDGSMLSNQLSQSQLLSQIRQASEDPLIKAVVVRVDSPGGGVVASNELHQALQKLREKGKVLVVSMGTVAASGGYYIATPADRIYANPDTLTGSLGVIVSSINYEEAFNTLGIQQIVYKSGEFKDILSPVRESTPEEQAIIQTFVDEAYNGFVDVIEAGRNMPRERVLELADGRIYSGRQAQNHGLIDELGGLEDAIEGAQVLAGIEGGMVVRYRMVGNFSDLLFGMVQKPQPDPLGIRQVMQPQPPKIEYRLVTIP
jgi:protease-4